jgi:hypothetical protein
MVIGAGDLEMDSGISKRKAQSDLCLQVGRCPSCVAGVDGGARDKLVRVKMKRSTYLTSVESGVPYRCARCPRVEYATVEQMSITPAQGMTA